MSEPGQIYEIGENALPDFLARIAMLSKKSIKLLGKPIAPVFHGDIVREITINGHKFDLDGNRFVRIFHRVSVTAETPKIHGWTFMATIDHAHVAGNLIRAMPGVGVIPVQYRTIEAHCDHCDVKRRRNDTFILRCDDANSPVYGMFKQIGRQCLRDFIGYDVSAFTESAKWLSGMEPSESDGEGGYGGGTSHDLKLTIYLAHVHAVIRKLGWVSKKEADLKQTRSTAGQAMENMFPLPKYRHLAIPLTDRDHAVATDAQAYAAALTGRTDYEYNLSIVARDEFITHNSTGLAASMVPALFRHQETALKRTERLGSTAGSRHLGTVGERLKGVAALVSSYRALPPERFGSVHVYHLRTPQNDVLVWFASSVQEFKIGDRVMLDGYVKKHDNYQGVNQTVVNRCAVTVQTKGENIG
jgi:hypothetical protein